MGRTTEPRRHDQPTASVSMSRNRDLPPPGAENTACIGLVWLSFRMPCVCLSYHGLDLGAPCDFDRGEADLAKAVRARKVALHRNTEPLHDLQGHVRDQLLKIQKLTCISSIILFKSANDRYGFISCQQVATSKNSRTEISHGCDLRCGCEKQILFHSIC